jgi:hypothetical protein
MILGFGCGFACTKPQLENNGKDTAHDPNAAIFKKERLFTEFLAFWFTVKPPLQSNYICVLFKAAAV